MNEKSITFSNNDPNLRIKIRQPSILPALVGTYGIKIRDKNAKENGVELGTESDHHFIFQIWGQKLFKENCARLYDDRDKDQKITEDFVLVYYYGKCFSVYQIKKSHVDKIKEMFTNITGRVMPFCLYFKFTTSYFLANL